MPGKKPWFLLGLLFLLAFLFYSPPQKIVVVELENQEVLNQIRSDFEITNYEKIFSFSEDSKFENYFRLNFSGDLEKLQMAPGVVSASYDFEVTASDIAVSDPKFTYDVADQEKQWWLSKIKVPAAWEVEQGSEHVTVAIVDTGVNGMHEDLNDGRVGAGYLSYCQIYASNGSCLVHVEATFPGSAKSDDNGHGTIIAGIIGAIPNNNRGMAGINWKVRIMPIKALDSMGVGVASDVSAGIVWAADNGADIINLSLGGTNFGDSAVLRDAIKYAFDRGILVVAAAGNDSALIGADLDINPVYPVCSDGDKNMVLGVTASDINDTKAGFSNFGRGCIDMIAPGTAYFNSRDDQKGIFSTYYDPEQPTKNTTYVFASGTSMASPIVAGVAALLKSANPDLAGTALRDRVVAAVDTIDNLNPTQCLGDSCTGRLGTGRVNAQKALQSPTFITYSFLQDSNGRIFRIEDGVRKLVSEFVFEQRNFDREKISSVSQKELELIPQGQSVPPLDGTLIKATNNPTIFLVDNGVLLSASFLAFHSAGFKFENVHELNAREIASYRKGPNLTPRNGGLIKLAGEPAVYYMHEGKKRLISYFSFTNRGLNFADVVEVGKAEFLRYEEDNNTKLQPPLDGTLIKGNESDAVFVIESGKKRLLSATAFSARGYDFRKVNILAQAEVNQYQIGSQIQ